MIIFEVRNKVSSALFVSEKDAKKYLSQYGSAANGLWIYELYVVDDTEQANKPVEPTASKLAKCELCGYDEHPGINCSDYQ